jgi:hypothetical protein
MIEKGNDDAAVCLFQINLVHLAEIYQLSAKPKEYHTF